MASAEHFLRLLEEKDLVSTSVLAAARREVERTSPPPDAVGLSLWLVQGQHITAAQAERLLTAVLEKAAEKEKTLPSRFHRGEVGAAEKARSTLPPPAALQRLETPPPPPPPSKPKPAASRPAAKSAQGDIDLAPLAEEEDAKKFSKPSSAPKNTAGAVPPPKSDAAQKWSGSSPPPTNVGAMLESLERTMQGPLDSLIESEGRQTTAFDDAMVAPSLAPAASKKFKLRRFLRNLFRRNKSKIVTVKAADPRQVKLLLVSWGVAILALVAALVTFRVISGRDAAEIRRDADLAVEKEDYGKAITYYDEYLRNKDYAKPPEGDAIRTLRVLAELRRAAQKADTSGDWTPAFDVAQNQVKALPQTRSPERMKKVGDALAKIADGLARQMQAKPDEASVKRVIDMTDLIDREVPKEVRPMEMLETINGILNKSRQEVLGRVQVQRAVEEIGSAVEAGELPRAYEAYRGVVREFADRVDDPELVKAMKLVSAAQQRAVTAAQQSLAATKTERPSDLLAAMPLAVQTFAGELPAATVAKMPGKLRFVLYEGTVYGLNAATGKVLWRRFVAHDPKLAAVSVLPLSDGAGSDVVLCDPVHEELLRVRGQTGELLWRLPIERPIVGEPVRAGKWLLLLTKDQRLLMVDAATGEAGHHLRLPQPMRLPPVVDAAHGLIYLVADQSNIYALGPDTKSADGRVNMVCRQVLHLGHTADTIAAAPTVVGDFLLLAINDSLKSVTLRVLSITKSQPDEPLQAVQRIPIGGNVGTSPAAMANGAVVVTVQGGMVALEPDATDGKKALRVVVRMEPALDERMSRFVLSDGQSFWVTGRQMTRYAVQSGDGQIVVQAASEQGNRFVQAPAIEGGTMFNVVQKPGLPGVIVSAIDLSNNQPVWQTWLAARLVGPPTLGSASGKLTAATASGGLFRLPLDALRRGAAPMGPVLCVEAARLNKPVSSLLVLPEGRFALSGGADTAPVAIYDPQADEKRFRWLVSPQELATSPAAFGGGVLAACLNGQVFLLDPMLTHEDMMLAKPYTTSLPGVTRWNWRTPQAADDRLAVLCDGDRRMIAIRLSGGAYPALAEAGVALHKAALVSPVAVLGKSAYVVDANDALLSFALPELSPGKTQPLGGHCAWGPQAVGKQVLVTNDKNQLFALDPQQNLIWKTDLKFGPLAGTPFSAGDDIYLASQSGAVWRISAADGKDRGKVDAGCPLGSGPLLVGARVIVGGQDGTLLEVKRP